MRYALDIVWCPRSSAAGYALVRVGSRLRFSSLAWITGMVCAAVSVQIQLCSFRAGGSMRSALVRVRAGLKGKAFLNARITNRAVFSAVCFCIVVIVVPALLNF